MPFRSRQRSSVFSVFCDSTSSAWIFENEPYGEPAGESPGGGSAQDEGSFVSVTDLLRTLRGLVDIYAEAYDYSPEELRRRITIENFVTFVLDRGYLGENRDDIPAPLRLPDDVTDDLREIFSNPYAACGLLWPIWSLLTVFEEASQSQPLGAIVQVSLKFPGDVSVRLFRRILFDFEGAPTTLGLCLYALTDAADAILSQIEKIGFDRLQSLGGDGDPGRQV